MWGLPGATWRVASGRWTRVRIDHDTELYDRVSRPPKMQKSTYDASQNEAPAEAERSPESAELQ